MSESQEEDAQADGEPRCVEGWISGTLAPTTMICFMFCFVFTFQQDIAMGN